MNRQALFEQFLSFTASVHQVTFDLTKNIKADAVTPLQYSILEYIAIQQPVTLSQISECQHMSMPNTSREIKKLSELNLCEKHDSTEDRRIQYIRLSIDGQAMMDEAFKQIEGRFVERIKPISDEDLVEIEQALKVLHKKIFF